MLDALLWRCPVCKINDTIEHVHRFFRPDKVTCHSCHSEWELFRVKGGMDYRLVATAGSMKGEDHPLAEWYDLMRKDFSLVTLYGENIPLQENETLFLKGKSPNLSVGYRDPRFAKAIAKLPPPRPIDDTTGAMPRIAHLGPVDLFLTNQRFIILLDKVFYGLDLLSIRGVEILLDRFMIIRHEKRLLEFIKFERESPLKWRAYFDLVLQPVREALGIEIRMPYD